MKRIVNDSSWKIVYLDETIVVFFRKTLPTPKIILREDVLDVAKRDSDPSRLIYLANFYRKAGWFEEEKILLEKALRINSWSFWANARLAQIYLASGNPILEYKAWALKEKLKNPIFWF